jgi:hypothetical protein
MTLSERRDTRRIILGAEYTARFTLAGHAFGEVRVTNISCGGCFLMVGKRDEKLFKKDALLEQFTLDHSELPKAPMTGQVVYALGGGSVGMDFIGIGVHFSYRSPDAAKGLEDFVVARLGPMPEA